MKRKDIRLAILECETEALKECFMQTLRISAPEDEGWIEEAAAELVYRLKEKSEATNV